MQHAVLRDAEEKFVICNILREFLDTLNRHLLPYIPLPSEVWLQPNAVDISKATTDSMQTNETLESSKELQHKWDDFATNKG